MNPSPAYKLVQLANGVHSVHSLAHRETFHPVIGPVAEAEALYVRQLRLPERLAGHAGEFVIWDVGLGAAANALTVLRAARTFPTPLRLISFDHTREPLQFARHHAAQLGYLGGYEEPLEQLLTHGHCRFTNGAQLVEWQWVLGDFPNWLEQAPGESVPPPHAILFDAFSPAKNPTMWTLPLFRRLFARLAPERPCAMPTYSRSTLLRVTLLLAGFYVGAGHATGEKEETTMAANSLELISEPLGPSWLRRARNSTSAEPLHEATYRQTPLSESTWIALQRHLQFQQAAPGAELRP